MPQMLEKVGKNFKILRKIDEGAFGQIFQAVNTRTNLEVAVKIEPVNTDHPQLIYECKLYNYLHNDSTVIDKGIPNIYYCSTEGFSIFLFRRLQRFGHGFDGPLSGIPVQPNTQEIFTEDCPHAHRPDDLQDRVCPQPALHPQGYQARQFLHWAEQNCQQNIHPGLRLGQEIHPERRQAHPLQRGQESDRHRPICLHQHPLGNRAR